MNHMNPNLHFIFLYTLTHISVFLGITLSVMATDHQEAVNVLI